MDKLELIRELLYKGVDKLVEDLDTKSVQELKTTITEDKKEDEVIEFEPPKVIQIGGLKTNVQPRAKSKSKFVGRGNKLPEEVKKEHRKAYQKKYYEKNRERRLEYMKDYRDNKLDKDKQKDYMKEYYAKEKKRAYMREYMKQYYQKNLDKVKGYQSKYRAKTKLKKNK